MSARRKGPTAPPRAAEGVNVRGDAGAHSKERSAVNRLKAELAEHKQRIEALTGQVQAAHLHVRHLQAQLAQVDDDRFDELAERFERLCDELGISFYPLAVRLEFDAIGQGLGVARTWP